jgi:hypothetical protein
MEIRGGNLAPIPFALFLSLIGLERSAMRQVVPLFGLALLGTCIASMSWSQTPDKQPHFEMVNGLRREGMPDLALQYLEKIKNTNLDPALRETLDLEFARTWLAIANEENEESKRTALINQAKQKFEAFIKANPKHEKTTEANVDLAKLYVVRGRAMIRKARRLDDPKELEAEMVEARKPLLEAVKRFSATAKEIEAKLKSLENPKTPADERRRRDLLESQLAAQLEEGKAYYSLGETYVGNDTKDVKAQGEQYKAAQKIFERIMFTDEKLPICWIARAWATQAQLKAGDAGASERSMKDLMERKNSPVAAAGVRIGRYFAILNTFDGSGGDYAKLEKETDSWLADYKGFRDTAEGLGCRFYLASARSKIAFSKGNVTLNKDNKIVGLTPFARGKLEEAQKGFKELSEFDNEYAERATRNRQQILVTLADADGQGDSPPLESLANFERAYLVAQVQIARLVQFRNGGGMTPPPPEEVAKEERRRYANALRYLEHALRIVVPDKDNGNDIFAAKLFLASCYNEMKLYTHAALLAENIARENPKRSRAGVAAAFAVSAYNRAQIELKQLRAKVEFPEGDAERQKAEKIWDDKIRADISRMRKAASFVITNWPDETATDEARHLLAFYALRDKRYPEAWRAYAGIRNGYPAVQVARMELASAMYTMAYPDEKDPSRFQQAALDSINKKYAKEWKQTVNLMENVPSPANDALQVDAYCYVSGKSQLARMYRLANEQDKAEKIATALAKEVDRFKNLSDDQKTELRQTAQNISLGAIKALAYAEFKAGNHARVAEMLDPKIEEIRKEFEKKAPDELTLLLQGLRKTQRETVVLALQSCVQDGKIKRASELLDLLDRSGGGAEESMAMMQTLVSSVRSQLDELEAAAKKATAENNKEEATARTKEAEALKSGFTELLKKLIGQGNALPIKMRLFLAQGLGSVRSYELASAELDKIRKMPPPERPTEPAGNPTDEQQAKFKREMEDFEGFTSFKRRAEYLLARNYAQAKEYAKAMAVFNEIIGPISFKGPTPKEKQGWGYASLAVRKEKALMMEEIAMAAGETNRMTKWGEAVQEWIAIARTFSPRLEPIRQNLAPLDEAKKIFLTGFTARDLDPEMGETEFSIARLAWFGHQFGEAFAQERAKAAKAAEDVATRRERYFELFFEQKRCSVMAFKSLGASAFKEDGPTKLKEKFASFAKEFKDFTDKSKNPDLSQDLRNRVKQLIDSVPELKREFEQLPK